MPVTPEELEQIRAEVRQEVIKELQLSITDWEDIKRQLQAATPHLYGPHQYQLINGVSTILRHVLGLRQIRYLRGEDSIKAKEIVDKIISCVKTNDAKGA